MEAPTFLNIIGSTQLQAGLSTSGQAQITVPSQGLYDIWSPTQPANISIQTAPVISSVPITSSNGYPIAAAGAPKTFMIPAGGVIVFGSSISSGVLCAEKIGNY